MHLEASLLHARGKQNFTSQQELNQESDALPPDHPDISNSDNLLDFDQLSEHLIVGVASANADRDIGDDDDEPPITVLAPPLRITIPPLNLATLSHQATLVKKTSIPLKILFKYPAATDLPLDESIGMNSFWRGGIQNLEKEMEAYKLLSLSEENLDVINPKIPTTH